MPMIDFNHVWNTIPFPAFIINSEFKIIEGNSSAEQIIHTSRNQMFGKELGVFFGINSVVLETVKQVRQQNSSLSQYGVEISTIDRVSFECNLHINPLDKNNEKYLLIIQPNSFAQKINQSSTQRTTARSVTAMASMLAHEIRNPLAGISGAAQLLAMNASDDDIELADMIGQETKRIGTLVDRFEVFSDIRPAIRDAYNIHDVLDRAIRSSSAGFASSIKFTKQYDPSLPDASGDADQMLQVFQNILKNACEAIQKDRGKIVICTSYNSGVRYTVSGNKSEILPLQIEIIDNGKGIPGNIIDEIFEPFVSSKVNGTGLGLAFVSKIVTSHGGLIECTTDHPGTKFTLRLPIWKKSAKDRI